MKILSGYLKNHFADRIAQLQFGAGLIIFALISLIYYGLDDINMFSRNYFGKYETILFNFTLFVCTYFISYLVSLGINNNIRTKIDASDFTLIAASILLLSISSSWVPVHLFVKHININYDDFYLTTKTLVNIQSASLLFIIPTAYFIANKPNHIFFRKSEWAVYRECFLLLILISPILYFISFAGGMNEFYPSIDDDIAGMGWLNNLIKIILYESSYIMQFISTEFFFRGIFVLILLRKLGPNVLLPMAVLYAVWHFGKPVPEIVSSYFGGYLLGIITMHTRNLWIPVLLHVGFALMIELFSYLTTV